MTHTFIEYIIQINTNMTCNEQKKEDGILSFFFGTNHKSYLHTRQYSY